MKCHSLSIEGLYVIEPVVFADDRGCFFESYSQALYKKNGIEVSFVQDNIAVSQEGVIRALHYQSTPGQAKLVSCLQGKIWDVAVDIRPNSPTFGKWVGLELDDQKHQQLFIPVGFAHGYCVLSKTAKVQYKVSSPYNPQTECSIRWNDPELQIKWPIESPVLSIRDQRSPFFQEVVWTK